MKSTIRIDYVDVLGNGAAPVIRINRDTKSDDPRDTLLCALLQSCGGYLELQYGHDSTDTPQPVFLITPRNKEALESPFTSRFKISDEVAFATEENLDKAFTEAKAKNPNTPDSQIEYTPDYYWGKVVAVKFTEAKVYYDVIHDVDNKVHEGIPSHYVKKLSEALK